MALAVAIYKQVLGKKNFDELLQAFQDNLYEGQTIHFLVSVILLMPVNLLLETFKWKFLARKQVPLPFSRFFKAVLAGITIALFTPNRVGDYGGKMLLIGPKYNWQAIMAAAIGGFCQMIVLIAVGLVGVIYLGAHHLHWEPVTFNRLLVAVFLMLMVMLYAYFNIKQLFMLGRFLPKKKWLKRLIPTLKILGTYNYKELSLALLIGTMRYGIYTSQYYMILRFYGLEIPVIDAYAGIGAIFLFQTIVPLPPLVGIVARGELALLIWNHFEANEISILGATFTLFVINLCLPAFVGLIYIVRINILKSLGNEY